MRNNTSITYNICLLIGDGIALIGGLSIAYILRVSISHEALSVQVSSLEYLKFLLILTPFWLFTFAILGLYSERYYQNRFTELARLFVGAVIGIMFAISYSYMADKTIFPARLVVIYGFIFSFVAVLIFRTLARATQRKLFSYGIGLNNVLVVGDTKTSKELIESLSNTVTGYRIIGVVGCKNHPVEKKSIKCYASFSEAITKISHRRLHTIIQTELFSSTADNDEILSFAQSNHIAYRFVPGNSELFVGNIKVDLLQSMPVIAVHQTAVVGWGRVVKRLTDFILGLLLLIISSPLWILITIAQKVTSPRGDVFFRVKRLSRYGHKVTIYKLERLKKLTTA
ncbi:MAG: sugar transferase [Candidatus Saccharibacteria bacterium]